MRLEEGKNRGERSAPSSTGMRARAHTHAHRAAPIHTAFISEHFSFKQFGSIYVCRAPSIPNPYPFIFSFQVLASADENRKRR